MNKHPRRKRKTRDTDEETIDRLQSEIRELKSTIRSLQKRLKKVDRGYKPSEEDQDVKPSNKKQVVQENDCHNCGKGYLLTNTAIPGRIFKSCSSCDYKSKIEKLK